MPSSADEGAPAAAAARRPASEPWQRPNEPPRASISAPWKLKPSRIRIDDRAADGVEAEHRIGADDGDAVDGVVGQEVPVDDVAEGLVDAHAVLIDGEALGERR